jgi:hypothetical protein
MSVCVWLSAKLAGPFVRHVGTEYGAASRFGKAAIEEKLRREGAFDGEQSEQAAAALKQVKPADLPLVVALAELLKTRGSEAVRAKLDELKDEAIAEVTA